MNAIVASPIVTSVPTLFNGFSFETARNAAAEANPELLAKWEQHAASATQKGIKGKMIGRSDTFVVSIFDLEIENGWNSRDMENAENLAHIEWLGENIAENGILEPLEVRFENDKLWIVDGHCRFFGAILAMTKYGAKIEGVKVTTVAKGSDKADRYLQQVLRNSGKRLERIETAIVYKKLLACGLTVQMIAKRVTKSVASIEGDLLLLTADPQVKALVNSGRIAPTEVSNLLRQHSAEKVTEIVTEAVAKEEAKVEAEGGDVSKVRVTRKKLDAAQGRMSEKKAIAEMRKVVSQPLSTNGPKKQVDQAVWDRLMELLDATA
jgi:ParB-like chromosome segregation protein Spo0J